MMEERVKCERTSEVWVWSPSTMAWVGPAAGGNVVVQGKEKKIGKGHTSIQI